MCIFFLVTFWYSPFQVLSFVKKYPEDYRYLKKIYIIIPRTNVLYITILLLHCFY